MPLSPLQELAQRISARLAREGLIQDERAKDVAAKLAAGKLSETDWRGELERKQAAESSAPANEA